LTAVIWALTDAREGDGGFWCIPGSHKAAFPLPRAIETYEVIPACVKQPSLRAGSVLIFTEALTHGTRNWSADHERVALFYKYSPAWMADQATDRRPASILARLSPEQARFLSSEARTAGGLP
jgi:ectoine hydroxylase-related dioxygenase (phytanoyl-CoA dioxygenase family)